jgi:hypothetical protein
VVDAPFTTWSSYKRHVTEHDFIVAERAYQQAIKMIEEKRSLLEKMEKQQEGSGNKKKKVNYSLIHR